MRRNTSRLTARLGALLLLALVAAGALFLFLRFGGAAFLEAHFERTGFLQQCNEKRISNFQSYIKKYGLGTKDTAQITKWAKTQPMILMEIYRSNRLLYTSYAPEETMENETESPHYAWVSYYEVVFSDGDADVVIYADDSYRFFTLLTIVSLGLSVLLFLFIFLSGSQSLIRYICELSGEIQSMEGGDLDVSISVRGNDELTSLAKSLDSMRRAFKTQKEHEAEMFQANQAMITQMSHDLRTPMTVLQIYTDILKYNRCKPEQVNDYLIKIDRKVAQMKQLSENLFEYSLISREQTIVLEGPMLFREAMHDLLSEAVTVLSEQGFSFDLQLDWPQEEVCVHPPYLKRIMDNVTSNISKYAAKDTAMQVKVGSLGRMVYLSIQNQIASHDTEQEGTHIGITNIRAMMDKMGGECRVKSTESVFRMELCFPVAGIPGKED